jgi:hypothetical protein
VCNILINKLNIDYCKKLGIQFEFKFLAQFLKNSKTKMERLGLSTFKSEMIKKLNITKIQDFYEISPLTVFAETQLNISDLNEITEIVSKKVAPKPKTALELLIEKSHDLRVLSTGCQDFDEILGGGIYYDGITELVGSPGVGKIHMCINIMCTT